MTTSATQEAPAVQVALIAVTVVLLMIFLLLPLVVVFTEALGHGLTGMAEALADPDAIAAIELTLIVAVVSVPLNAASPPRGASVASGFLAAAC